MKDYTKIKKLVEVGRPKKPKEDQRTALVKTLLTEDELERAQATADTEGQTMSAWVRGLILRELKTKEAQQ